MPTLNSSRLEDREAFLLFPSPSWDPRVFVSIEKEEKLMLEQNLICQQQIGVGFCQYSVDIFLRCNLYIEQNIFGREVA